MNYFKFIIFIFVFSSFISCGSDDDICESGEGTPRMKITFKKDNKVSDIDSVNIVADMGANILDLGWAVNKNSVLVPLRVDDSPFTDLYVRTSTQVDSVRVRVDYTTKAIYVSPGCGVKKNYENVNAQLMSTNSLTSIETGKNVINNEEETILFFNFQ